MLTNKIKKIYSQMRKIIQILLLMLATTKIANKLKSKNNILFQS